MPDMPAFTWDHSQLSAEGNLLFAGLLDVFFTSTINARMAHGGRQKITPQDVSDAFRLTLEWAQGRFPHLDVGHNVTPP